MIEKKHSIILTLFLLVAGICGADWFVCGFVCAAWSVLLLVSRLGKSIPVLELPMILGGVQWVVAPYLIYQLGDTSSQYVMLLDPSYYAGIVVPSYILFCLGIELSNQEIIPLEKEECLHKLIWLLLFLFLVGNVMRGTMLAIGSFFHMLASLFGVVALLAFFFIKGKFRFLFISLFFFQLIFDTIRTGMFHSILIWGYWFMVYLLYRIKASRKQKILVILVGVLFIGICQGVKWNYRKAELRGELSDFFIFSRLASDWVTNDSSSVLEDEDFLVRFNQGWHISEVILYMDATGNYLNGSSIWDSVKSILLPRYFAPDKRRGGGRENFAAMTAHELTNSTSMNVSYVGEGYGNWGKYGAWFFPFAVGCLLGCALKFINYVGKTYWEIIYFIPVIFFYAVKVEGDFFTSFNQYVKLTLIALGVIYVYRTYLQPPQTGEGHNSSFLLKHFHR